MPKRRRFYLVFAVLILLWAPTLLSTVGTSDLQDYDFSDNNISNVDGVADIGTHSNFTAQQYGPDSIYDSLTEESAAAGSITYKNSAESNSTIGVSSHNFNYPLQKSSGNERLVVVTVSWEDQQTGYCTSCMFDGVEMTKVDDVQVDTGDAWSEYIGLFYLLDSSLPSSAGDYEVNCTASEGISRQIYMAIAEYSGVEQLAPDDYDTDANTAAGNTAVTLTAATDGSVVVAGVGEGGTNALTNTNNINNLQEEILASSGSALGHHTNVDAGNITVGWNNLGTREGMVGAVWQPASSSSFELDLEVQWTNANYTRAHEELCIFGGNMGLEDIRVDVWSGSTWQNLFTDLSSGWNNISVTGYLVTSTFTLKFSGGAETGDLLQDSWEIDCTLIHTWEIPPIASFTYSPDTPYTSETVTFNASESYDPDGTITAYLWDFGEGTNGTGETATHGFQDDGTYTVTLTVTDNDGLQNSTSTNITVLNRPPVAIFTESAETAYTGETINFNASQSYDPDGTITNYHWNFGDGTNTTGVTATHAYANNGNYTVTLTVTDDDGAVNSATSTKEILNRLPVAIFTESAETAYTGETITFNASSSYDPDGVITDYLWNFGDGTNTTGVTTSHSYTDNGTYVVTLTVTDNDGATDSTTATKTVLNRLPVAIFTESTETAYVGQPITFNASNSYDPDGWIVQYFWDFGDGTNTTGVSVEHAYSTNGSYVVTLTVFDDDGASDVASATKTIILNEKPVAIFTESAETAYTGETITFNASSSYDPDGVITDYLWNFGDGLNTTGIVATHSYTDDGIYIVTLTVFDDKNATDTTSATKTILNRLPVAIFTESAETAYTGETINFNASQSYDPDGTITNYHWNFGDGTNTTGVTATHAYANNGNYTVTLTVTDNDGGEDSAQATKMVLEGIPDVAIVDVTPSTLWVYKHRVFNVSVIVSNEGVRSETFNVTLYRSDVYGWHLEEIDGHQVWYSDKVNNADLLLIASLTIPVDSSTLMFDTLYNIENLFDFGFVQISTDEGVSWDSLENAYTTYNYDPTTSPEIIANLPGLTGTNDGWPEWKTMAFNLSEYAGETVLLGFRYMTDSGLLEEGWYINNVTINGVGIPNLAFEPLNPPPLQAIQTLTVNNLPPGNQTSLVFYWNTTDTPIGRYQLSAMADPIVGEVDLVDNSFVYGIVGVWINPDLDGDGDVDIFDVVILAAAYGSREGDPDWDPRLDLVEDGEINIYDIVIVTTHYGETI